MRIRTRLLWSLMGPGRAPARGAWSCRFLGREEPILLPASFIACTANDYPAKPFFTPFADKARKLGWPFAEVNSGHDGHVERPQ